MPPNARDQQPLEGLVVHQCVHDQPTLRVAASGVQPLDGGEGRGGQVREPGGEARGDDGGRGEGEATLPLLALVRVRARVRARARARVRVRVRARARARVRVRVRARGLGLGLG